MRSIILAAGVGSRLRPLTDSVPKCLVEVAGRPILDWQINALLRAGVNLITVVAGYRSGDVIDYCARFGDAVNVLVNAAYDSTNNMVSLRLALQAQVMAETLICNGDVVFDPTIARRMVASPISDIIAVEPSRYIEESMKITVGSEGRVSSISKTVAKERSYGVSIDLYRFSQVGIEALARTADRLIRTEGQANLWTEVAIDAMLGEVVVRPFDIMGRRWIEVDNFDDLAEGERLFAGHT